jgi:hypothetical protein
MLSMKRRSKSSKERVDRSHQQGNFHWRGIFDGFGLTDNIWFQRVLLALILIVGCAVRLYRFGEVPAGVFIDEANNAYDAYAILHFGIDRLGLSYPVHLASNTDGMNVLSAYLSIPFIYFFGLNVVTTRIVNLLSGLLSLGIFFLLLKKIDRRTALIGTFLLAISPWHIMLSRWGLESNLLPAVFLLGAYFMVRAAEAPRFLWLSAGVFGLAMYAYGTAYITVPLFLFGSWLYLLHTRRISFRQAIIAAAVFGIVALPIILFILINIFKWSSIHLGPVTIPRLTAKTPRYESFTVLFHPGFLAEIANNLANFGRMLIQQEDCCAWNFLEPFGFLYPISLPFIVIGLGVLCWRMRGGKWRANGPLTFMTLWLILGLFLAAIVDPNVNRLNILWLPAIFLMALSVPFFRPRLLRWLVLSIFLCYFVGFTMAYFTSSPLRIGRYLYDPAHIGHYFFASVDEAIRFANTHTTEPICFYPGKTGTQTNAMHFRTYAFYYNQLDPHIIADAMKDGPTPVGFDRYTFDYPTCEKRNIRNFIFRRSRTDEPFNTPEYAVTYFEDFGVALHR